MKRPAVNPAFDGVGNRMDLMAPKATRSLRVHPSFRVANAHEVGDIVFAAHLKPNLLADERETCPQLEQELTDMGHESPLDLPLFGLSRRCKKLEVVGVLQQLASKVGLETGQGRSKFVLALPCRS